VSLLEHHKNQVARWKWKTDDPRYIEAAVNMHISMIKETKEFWCSANGSMERGTYCETLRFGLVGEPIIRESMGYLATSDQ
jgi:hypothetical protein